jgi:two-component system, LytTR family, sensor kinase
LHLSRRAWALACGAWLAWGLLWALEEVVRSRVRGDPIPLGRALVLQVSLAAAWALLTPGIIWLGRRWPLEDGRWPIHAALHLTTSVVVLFALGTLYQAVAGWVGAATAREASLLTRSAQSFAFWFLSDSLLYWTVIFADYAVRQYAAVRDREVHASQLEAQLAQARLASLKMQLQPHFLFNALHTIGTLVRTGQANEAVRIVAGLGDLLRAMLDDAATQEVPLRQELSFLRSYLEIEQIRFSDRLHVVFAVDDETLDATVPHLILQPLVENALRHGIAPAARGGRLIVSARRVDRHLLLSVRDDGRGVEAGNGHATQRGLGLANVQHRLAQLFGPDSSVVVEPAPSGGTDARITIPFRLTTAALMPE